MKNNTVEIIAKALTKEIVLGGQQSVLTKIFRDPDISLKKLSGFLAYNELIPFVYPLLKEKKDIFSDDFGNYCKWAYYKALRRYTLLLDETIALVKAAGKVGLNLVPIKGFSFGEAYYKKFGFRPLIDIDFLIKEDSLGKGMKFLTECQYEKYLLDAEEEYWRQEQCHIAFKRMCRDLPVVVELHWALDFKRFSEYVLPSLWSRLLKKKFQGFLLNVLSPEDSLFSIVLHQRRFGKVLNLKYVCDAAMLLYNEGLDWDYIIRIAFSENMRTSLYWLLYQTSIVFDYDLSNILNRLKIPGIKKKIINGIIRKSLYQFPSAGDLPYLYMRCHLLLYDNMSYPVGYMMNVPLEQFAKFYKLPLKTKKTQLFYRMRVVYFLYRIIKKLFFCSKTVSPRIKQ